MQYQKNYVFVKGSRMSAAFGVSTLTILVKNLAVTSNIVAENPIQYFAESLTLGAFDNPT